MQRVADRALHLQPRFDRHIHFAHIDAEHVAAVALGGM